VNQMNYRYRPRNTPTFYATGNWYTIPVASMLTGMYKVTRYLLISNIACINSTKHIESIAICQVYITVSCGGWQSAIWKQIKLIYISP